MLPVASPAPVRPFSGPTATPAGQLVNAALPPGEARSQIPPVVQVAAQAETRLRHQDSRSIRDALQVGQRNAQQRVATGAQEKPPQDRAVFRAKVIRFLTALHQDDQSFQRALKQGTIVIHAVADPPRPELRPELSYERYRLSAQRAQQADRPGRTAAAQPGGPVTVGPRDFIAWWPNRH